jgi:hypothetical protein
LNLNILSLSTSALTLALGQTKVFLEWTLGSQLGELNTTNFTYTFLLWRHHQFFLYIYNNSTAYIYITSQSIINFPVSAVSGLPPFKNLNLGTPPTHKKAHNSYLSVETQDGQLHLWLAFLFPDSWCLQKEWQ